MNITHVTIFGVGAAGSGVLSNLVCVHPELRYAVVDFDTVEERNIKPGTQPYLKADINRPKVQAIQRIIRSSRDKTVEAHHARISSVDEIIKLAGPKESSLIIDAFDNASSRNLFLELKGYNVLHVGFSAVLTGEATWETTFTRMSVTKSGKAAGDVCEMPLARPFISCLTAMATMVASRFIISGEKANVYFDSKLKTIVY